MKRENLLARALRCAILFGLIFIACFASEEAQAAVFPRVCVESSYQTGTVTLAADAATGSRQITVNGTVPPFLSLVINPGGQNEERVPYVGRSSSGGTLVLIKDFVAALSLFTPGSTSTFPLAHNHNAGEPVRFEGYFSTAYFGYHSTNNQSVTIPRAFATKNFFFPGPSSYPVQPTQFLPGIHDNVFSITFGGQGLPSETFNWVLGDMTVTPAVINQGQGCGTITYQGKLSDAGNPANGQYDLRFTVYGSLSEGTPQSDNVTVENATVTNGIFTVQLNFGSAFTNNDVAKFLEIGVRPGAATGNDPFTVLTPRQPITKVPFAVNAQTAVNATNAVNAVNATNADKLGNVAANQYVLTTDPRLSAANNTNFIQNTTTQQTANFNISGNGTIGGNLTVIGTINGIINANFGQSVTTVSGSDKLLVTSATTAYTSVPGLTQTVNVPANSSLLISTDGGIQSIGSISTFSVIDVAIFVDGTAVSERRIDVNNFAVTSSVGNWALSLGQTLSPGNHTIEVKVRYGFNGAQSAFVSDSSSNPLLRGQLTVAVIKN